MKLNEFERNSSTWAKLEKYIKDELALLRERNDADSDQISTAKLRGRIFELKKILSLVASDERAVEQ